MLGPWLAENNGESAVSWRVEIRPLRTTARYRPVATRPALVLPRRFAARGELRLHRIPWYGRLRLPASPAVKLFGRPALATFLRQNGVNESVRACLCPF